MKKERVGGREEGWERRRKVREDGEEKRQRGRNTRGQYLCENSIFLGEFSVLMVSFTCGFLWT